MTLALIFGGIAAFYFLWLLFRLASLALPIVIAIGAAFHLLEQQHGYLVSIIGAALAGAAVLDSGKLVFARARSPLVRLVIGSGFAIPAAAAGYQATGAVAALAIGGTAAPLLSIMGGLLTALAAWNIIAADRGSAIPRQVSGADARSTDTA